MADDEKNIEETTDETVVDKTVPYETAAETEEATAEVSQEVSDTEVPETSAEAEAPVSDTSGEPGAAPAAPAKPSRSQRHVPRSGRRTRTKLVRERPQARKTITRTEKPEAERGRRQERRGVVVSDKGDKTIIVKVDVIKSHPKYKKVIRTTVKFHAHDEANIAGVGDTVRIIETRPLSKLKHWRLAEVVEKAR
jgi:small subunit ribosomal protein S17